MAIFYSFLDSLVVGFKAKADGGATINLAADRSTARGNSAILKVIERS